jgi:hypothetical protein
MMETNPNEPATERLRGRLRELRRGLLHLHKALLDTERAGYEQAHAPVSSGELLQLVISHEQFAWLHAISELIVSIDEMLDADEADGATAVEAKALLARAQALLKPSETGTVFEQKYYAALQSDPGNVLAHRAVREILSKGD